MKAYVVVNSWSSLEEHYQQYIKIFLNPLDAYKFALEIAIEGKGDKPEVIEEEIDEPVSNQSTNMIYLDDYDEKAI